MWDKFRHWVTVTWSQPVFIVIVCILAICGVMAFLSFFKKSTKDGSKVKWAMLAVSIVFFVLLALVCAAKIF